MRDEEVCKKVLEVLLKFKISNIKYIEDEKTINIGYDAKSIRLDIYVEEDDKIYNIEMQVANKEDLGKRSRYYQGMIDLNSIEKGEYYKSLKESYVIFICTFDPFEKGLPKYTFENICKEDSSLLLKDGAYKIFFNTKSFEKEEDTYLKSFLKYIEGEIDDNDFINMINNKIKKIKDNIEWRQEYMTLLMKEQEKFEEGLQQGMIKQIKALKKYNIGEKEIIKTIINDYCVTEEEVKKYL